MLLYASVDGLFESSCCKIEKRSISSIGCHPAQHITASLLSLLLATSALNSHLLSSPALCGAFLFTKKMTAATAHAEATPTQSIWASPTPTSNNNITI